LEISEAKESKTRGPAGSSSGKYMVIDLRDNPLSVSGKYVISFFLGEIMK
jgi:hypothetical protein